MSMRCTNAACPYLVRHGRAAEYRASTTTCSDCGGPLVDAATTPLTSVASSSALPVPTTKPLPIAVIGAAIVSVLAAAFVPLLSRVPLPYVDSDVVAEGATSLSVGALSVAPWLSAAIVVEIAALLVPRWRRLRHGGPETRARLSRASTVLGVVFAVVMAVMSMTWMARAEVFDEIAPALNDSGPGLIALLSLVTGACLVRLVVEVVARFGIGNGFGIVLAGTAIADLVQAAHNGWSRVDDGMVPGEGLVGVAVLVATIAVTWFCVRVVENGGSRHDNDVDTSFVVWPSAGIVPVSIGINVALPTQGVARFVLTAISGDADVDTAVVVTSMAVALLFVPVCAWLFSSPRRAALARARIAGRATASSAELAQAMGSARRALLPTIALNLLLLLAFGFGVDAVLAALVVVVVKDAVIELKARREQPDLVAVWPLYRFDLVAPTLHALDGAGITAHLRGGHLRALDHFFAPYVPIDVLVPAADAERARGVVASIVAAVAVAPSSVDARAVA